MAQKSLMDIALKEAVLLEQKGYAHYLALADRVEHPLSKRLFESLAKQEQDHEERINRIYGKINEGGGDFETANERTQTSIEQIMRATFESLQDVTPLRDDIDDTEGYELAMQLERESIDAYADLLNMAEGEKEKKFFGTLKSQEEEHLTSLENVLRYLDQSGDFHQMDESQVWNWMNT